MTEQQRYDVLESFDGVELRLYPSHVVAEIEVDGTFESAGNTAFRPLVNYISGNNTSRSKVAMTAPVVQQEASQQIAMTAPVLQSAAAAGDRFVVGFVLPHEYTVESAPIPNDPRVQLRQVPDQRAMAVRFSGRWSKKGYDEAAEKLTHAVAAAGYTLAGPLTYARFDPPWTPWFMRRNEIVAVLAEST